MRIFQCDQCNQLVFFENTVCERCRYPLGYRSTQNSFSTLVQDDDGWKTLTGNGETYRYCDNHAHGVCNWLVPAEDDARLCVACNVNGIIPDLNHQQHVGLWRKLEYAKHRLIYSLIRFGLPLKNKIEDPERGLSFEFRSDDVSLPASDGVKTGHLKGTITINLAEADDAKREETRGNLSEPYRTLIGHFRHEIGHYYWERIIQPRTETLNAFRDYFGDERCDYESALQRYYQNGPPDDWPDRFVTAYSSVHPWEEWAETWAHYFHIIDTLETAYAFRIRLEPDIRDPDNCRMRADFDPYDERDFNVIIAAAIPLTIAINSLNRGMGQPDLYPFAIPPPVMEKLNFIHQLLTSIRVDPSIAVIRE